MDTTRFTLYGQVPAQKNAKQIAYNRRTGKPFVMTAQRVKEWQKDAAKQLVETNITPCEGVLRLDVILYHKDHRKRDLDNELSTIQDLLKNNGIIADDNCFTLVATSATFGGVDKDNPRAEVTISNIEQ